MRAIALWRSQREETGADPMHTAGQHALVLTLFLRLAYSLFAAIVGQVQPVNWRLVHSNALTSNLSAPDHSLRYLLLGVWERFDTLWYIHIAANGYDRPDAVVFFPLYPALIRIASLLISPVAAALLISTVAAFFLFWGLQELLVGNEPPDFVDQSLLVCAIWPASFVFFAGYPESLLAALIVWSLSMARKQRWLLAVALGSAAALTKVIGVVVAVPLFVVAIRERRWVKALSILFVPLASAAFLVYLHWTAHAPLTSVYQQYWRTSMAPPWTTLWLSVRTLARTPNPILALNALALVSISVLALRSRLRIEHILYSAAAIIVFICKETNPPLQSVMRYVVIIFPAFAGFARVFDGAEVRPTFAVACAALLMINLGLLWLFVGWRLVL